MDTFFCMLILDPFGSVLTAISVYRDASEAEKRFLRTGDFFVFIVFVASMIVVSIDSEIAKILGFVIYLYISLFSLFFISHPPISAPCAPSLRTRFPGMEEDYPHYC